MFESLRSKTDREDTDLVRELQASSTDNPAFDRAHNRMPVEGRLQAAPGNLGDDTAPVEGNLVDISAGGCMGVFKKPLHVGDVYRVHFDTRDLLVTSTYARCLRARVLRDTAFEAGFAFFASVDLTRPKSSPNTPDPTPSGQAA
ncbi:MAG: PilZ domain-containing protein [Planctomycetota bacterium]